MMSHQYGNIVFECDGDHCHESLETETLDFSIAQYKRRDAKWYTVKDCGDWFHFCSKDCRDGG